MNSSQQQAPKPALECADICANSPERHRAGDGCFCACCMKADIVWQLRVNLEAAEQSLALLCAAQRLSMDDLLKQVDARRI